MLDYMIFAVTVVIFLIFAVIYLYPGSKKLTTIPGPEPIDPLEGNFPDIKSSGSLNEFLEKIHDAYGTIASFWAGTQLCVSVASASLFKEQSHLFDRPGELFRAAALLWDENCLFTMNGMEGRKKHSFIKGCLGNSFLDFFLISNSKLLVQQVKTWSKLPADQYFPLYDKTSSFVLKSVMTSFLGCGSELEPDLISLKGNLENMLLEVEHYILDFQDVDGRREKRLNQYKESVKTFIFHALKSRRSERITPNERLLPIDKIMQLSEEEAQKDLLNLVCDAYFKCASFVTWFGYFLALEPDVQDKLRKELTSVEADKLSMQDITRFDYFQLVTKEVLRCAGIVPFTARCQNTDSKLESHTIPAGTPVLHALGVVSNDSKIFDNPEEFNPERFKGVNPSHFAFHPFGFAGQRTCPGSQVAIAQVAAFYAHVLRSFELELAPNQFAAPNHGFYVRPKEEVWLTLKARL